MNKLFTFLGIIPILTSFSFTSPVLKEAEASFKTGRNYDSTKALDFTDSTQSEIDDYYGKIGSKKGSELLTYLYEKISLHNANTTDGQKYFVSYDKVGNWYSITDRNWAISEKIDEATFVLPKSASKTSQNTYFYNAYISDSANNDITKAYSNLVNSSFKVDSSLTYIDYANKKKPNSLIQVDKEHMWAKNHGFKVKGTSGDTFALGAPTDLHHLMAADHNTNSAGHNDHFFGNVDKTNSNVKTIYNYLADGSSEISGWLDTSTDTFEPTDEWKGNVARALLYMGTRYSAKLDVNTQAEPYLYLTDDKSYADDDANRSSDENIFHGVQYNLSTLLDWNELDPVSEYEKHRNNLIYKNVQDNRNPYIDHPEWARRVYDVNYTDNIFESFDNKEFDGRVGDSITLPITFDDESKYTSTYDSEYIKVEGNKVTLLKEGTTTLTFTENETKTEHKATIIIKREASITDIEIDNSNKDSLNSSKTSITIQAKKTFTLNISTENLLSNEEIVLEIKNSSIASLTSSNTIKALKEGETTIDVILKDTNKNTSKVLQSIKLIVEKAPGLTLFGLNEQMTRIVLIAGGAIILLLIIIIVIFLMKKDNKKTKKQIKKTTKNVAKKVVKSNSRKHR